MSDATQKRVDRELDSSIDLFERADVGSDIAIEPFAPKSILVATDGSTQDDALVKFARQLHDRLSCKLGYFAINDSAFENARPLEGDDVEQVEVDAALEHDFDRVLAAVAAFEPDLLMLPCPFNRDFESLGEDSVGTTMEVITSRIEIPAIYLRRPDAVGRDPADHVRIVLTRENAASAKAAGWAAGLVKPTGRLELLLMVEKSTFQNFKQIMHSIQPDKEFNYEDLESALAKTYARLHAGLQQASREHGFQYELLIRYEDDPQSITPEDPQSHPALMTLGVVRQEHDSRNEVYDFVRRSPHPVLVVPLN